MTEKNEVGKCPECRGTGKVGGAYVPERICPKCHGTDNADITPMHDEKDCKGHFCPFHNPSNHLMKDWKKHVRYDRGGLTERICKHGIGHPDPDSLAWLKSKGSKDTGIHGCDGCCSGGNADMKDGLELLILSDGGWTRDGEKSVKRLAQAIRHFYKEKIEEMFTMIKSDMSDYICKTGVMQQIKIPEIVLNEMSNDMTDKLLIDLIKALDLNAEQLPKPKGK